MVARARDAPRGFLRKLSPTPAIPVKRRSHFAAGLVRLEHIPRGPRMIESVASINHPPFIRFSKPKPSLLRPTENQSSRQGLANVSVMITVSSVGLTFSFDRPFVVTNSSPQATMGVKLRISEVIEFGRASRQGLTLVLRPRSGEIHRSIYTSASLPPHGSHFVSQQSPCASIARHN